MSRALPTLWLRCGECSRFMDITPKLHFAPSYAECPNSHCRQFKQRFSADLPLLYTLGQPRTTEGDAA